MTSPKYALLHLILSGQILPGHSVIFYFKSFDNTRHVLKVLSAQIRGPLQQCLADFHTFSSLISAYLSFFFVEILCIERGTMEADVEPQLHEPQNTMLCSPQFVFYLHTKPRCLGRHDVEMVLSMHLMKSLHMQVFKLQVLKLLFHATEYKESHME